jgi:hypothetical protein
MFTFCRSAILMGDVGTSDFTGEYSLIGDGVLPFNN